MTHNHGIGEQHGIRDHDPLSVRSVDDRRARLNIFHDSLKTGDGDSVADFKRFLQQQQDARKEILECPPGIYHLR